MSFRLVPKSVTLNGEMALFCVILPNLVVSGAHCVKVVDKAITIHNLRLLCLVVNICRGTARRQRYKFLDVVVNEVHVRLSHLLMSYL